MTRLVLATLLALAPGLAVAEGCMFGYGSETARMSCADGYTYDAEAQTCVAVVSS